ncbi:MAG: VanZ domain-containing protein [Oscillospiraceae bacterium]|jgi:hypothetical protein
MQEYFLNLLARIVNILFQVPLSITGAMLWGLILYFICLPLFFRKKELAQKFSIALLFLYTAALLQSNGCLTIPVAAKVDRFSIWQTVTKVEWNPFFLSSVGLQDVWTTLLDAFLALIPVGFLAPLTGSHANLGKMLVLSLLCGAFLEIFQLFANVLTPSAMHSVSTGEAILSAAGCLTGYLFLTLLRKLPIPRHKARHYAHPGQVT